MAKGKNYNPADAYRKAQRKKELAKNKESRKQAKEIATVKKDTTAYEEEIGKLLEQERTAPLTAAQKSRLSDLKGEVARINAAKDAFVEAHPEQRKLVHRARAPKPQDRQGAVREDRSLFGKNGLPLHPERSIYYDPKMNPYGMPPPGMPYVERPPTPVSDSDESMSEDEGEEDDDDEEEEEEEDEEDIPMPPGSAADEDSDEPLDKIPLPSGAPPKKQHPLLRMPPPLPPGPPPLYYNIPPLPYSMLPMPTWPSVHTSAMFSAAAMHYSPTSGTPPSSLPAKPMPMSRPPPPVEAPPQAYNHSPLPPSSAVISAPAALRDLKAEATAFVPSTIKRRKATEAA